MCAVVLAAAVGVAGSGAPAGAADAGPQVRSFALAPEGGSHIAGAPFEAFPVETSYGAHVAAGNLDGDGTDELAFGTTEGSTSQVRTTHADGASIRSFAPYAPSFPGGAAVAIGNLDADPEAEVVTGAGPGGGPHVRVFNADATPLNNFMAYPPAFTGGVRVAVGDVTGDSANEIITGPGPGMATTVRVFSSNGTQLASFDAYAPLNGGVWVAVGELQDGGKQEIVTGSQSQQVRVFDGAGQSLNHDFLVPGSPQGDVRVAVGPINGVPRIVTASDDATEPIGIYSATGSRIHGFDPAPTADREYTVAVANGKVVTAETGAAPPTLPDGLVTTAPGGGGGPHVRSRPVPTGASSDGFMAYEPAFAGGVNVAHGDLDGDGLDEIVTGPARGRAPVVRTFEADGAPRSEFLAYAAGFTGGVDVAIGDLDGDGIGEIVTAAGAGGGPHVRVFAEDGEDLTGGGFHAYAPAFSGGVRVAAGDLDGDGAAEIVTAPAGGGGPHVKVFLPDGEVVEQFMAYAPSFTGGVDVATGDVDSDSAGEIITGAGPGGGPHVRVLWPDGTEVGGFMAFGGSFGGGVKVGSVDTNQDGEAEIVTGAGAGGGPHVRVLRLDGSEVVGYFAYAPDFHGGVDVAGGGV